MGTLIKENKFKAAIFFGAVALGIYTVFSRGVMYYLFSRPAFYCLLAMFLGWVAAIGAFAWSRREEAPAFFRANGWGFLFCAALSAFVFLSARPELRILSDETNLLSVSKTMLYERRVENVIMGKWYYFNFQPLDRVVETRPFAYPFFVCVAHVLAGFSPANAFAVNFVLFALLLCGVFALFRGLYGRLPGYFAVLLTCAQPLLSASAASGGIDLMAAAFLFFSFLAMREFLRREDGPAFTLFLATLLVLANVRYEGPAFLVVAAAGLLAAGRVKSGLLGTWQFALAPFIMLPAFWQRCCLTPGALGAPEATELAAVFSGTNFLNNAATFFRTILDPGFFFPYALPVSLLGIAGGLYFLFRLVADSDRPAPGDGSRGLAWTSLCVLGVYAAVVLSYVSGNAAHPAMARYFAPAALLLSLMSAWLLARPAAAAFRVMALVFSAAVFIVYNAVAVENRFLNTLLTGREYHVQADFLKRLGDKNVLVISDRPGQFAAFNYGAVSFVYARGELEALVNELERHLYDKILVFQEIEYATGRPTDATALVSEYALVPLLERQNTPTSFIRISELRPAPPEPAPGRSKR